MNDENIWDKDFISDQSLEILSGVKTAIHELDLFDEEFKDIFSKDAGVWEKYTIEEHTLMVLRQFDRYFAGGVFPDGITDEFFRTMFVLHDLGKPMAVKQGNIKLQHDETVKVVDPILKKLGFSKFEINLIEIIVGNDPIGPYLRYDKIDDAIFKIKKMIKESGLSPKDFFAVLLIYYMCDSGSYTSDAGGKPSLEYVFDFDHENKKLEFSPEYQEKMSELIELMFN
jgi:hypothetical protein